MTMPVASVTSNQESNACSVSSLRGGGGGIGGWGRGGDGSRKRVV